MKAMILAAGLGERMRPLTDHTPKPLLEINGSPLIKYSIEKLKLAGLTELVINVSWLAGQIKDYLGDGSAHGVGIQISEETSPLETAGGIRRALSMLVSDEQPRFLLVNGDVWCDLDFRDFVESAPNQTLAHLLMVANPEHNPAGDFLLQSDGLLANKEQSTGEPLTYAGIAVLHRDLFLPDKPIGKEPLAPLLRAAAPLGKVSGRKHQGEWLDIGTPERLQQLDQALRSPH